MDELIPLSHLSLDLPEPLCGWESELGPAWRSCRRG